jgi:hypothetical protein
MEAAQNRRRDNSMAVCRRSLLESRVRLEFTPRGELLCDHSVSIDPRGPGQEQPAAKKAGDPDCRDGRRRSTCEVEGIYGE